ncbi:MAG: transcriptional repressor [Rhodobiaceae bacterium]|nr:transcriptional repressor [Rhodobiaceae bacterium]MCC0055362.1 transcriptional repressor [Rhodobiaceae bacterium]
MRESVENKLRDAGLRPTRQRVALGSLLLDGRDRHVTAEALHVEAVDASIPVSLATVYNTLHQFTEAGLLREVAVNGSKSYFDTNVSNHHHYYIENENRLIDIDPPGSIRVEGLPQTPEGMEVTHVDVVVRLRTARAPRR